MSNQNEIQRLAHELEVAEFSGDPGLQPSSPDWHQHPLFLAYEAALDDMVLAEDLPLVPLIEARREDDETQQQYVYQVRQWRQGYGSLRRLADTGGRSMRTALILSKSRAHRWPAKPEPPEMSIPPVPHPSAVKARADKYVRDHYVVVNGRLYPKRKKR